uniref:RCC1 domain-containing protein 1 n=1 Tax=Castor canadensis TaxID=51338 RepID=A0A8C0WS95_CASCN
MAEERGGAWFGFGFCGFGQALGSGCGSQSVASPEPLLAGVDVRRVSAGWSYTALVTRERTARPSPPRGPMVPGSPFPPPRLSPGPAPGGPVPTAGPDGPRVPRSPISARGGPVPTAGPDGPRPPAPVARWSPGPRSRPRALAFRPQVGAAFTCRARRAARRAAAGTRGPRSGSSCCCAPGRAGDRDRNRDAGPSSRPGRPARRCAGSPCGPRAWSPRPGPGPGRCRCCPEPAPSPARSRPGAALCAPSCARAAWSWAPSTRCCWPPPARCSPGAGAGEDPGGPTSWGAPEGPRESRSPTRLSLPARHGQLGHGTLEAELEPRPLEALQGLPMAEVAAGGWHSVCVSDTGDIYVWGWNESGQLALPTRSLAEDGHTVTGEATGRSEDGSAGAEDVPVIAVQPFPALLDLPGGAEAAKASCGSRHTAVVTRTGELFTWGWGKYGQLGHRDTTSWDRPRLVGYFADKRLHVKTVTCGPWNTYVYAMERGES